MKTKWTNTRTDTYLVICMKYREVADTQHHLMEQLLRGHVRAVPDQVTRDVPKL